MAETIYSVIKDLLIRCELPLQLCRGQTYDGAANMLRKRSGVAARMLDENAAAIPVHCFGHCLNLILQDAGRKLVLIRDTLDLVKEICNLIRFSPKRLHLFSTNLQLSTDDITTLKPLSTTRWTARTSATEAVLKDYSVLMSTLSEIHSTSRDEYGLRAAGLLNALEKFSTLFGLRLCQQLLVHQSKLPEHSKQRI